MKRLLERCPGASAVGVMLLIGLMIRLVYLWQYKSAIPYYSTPMLDSAYYDNWAWKLAEGNGYGPMPFYCAPLYPYLVAFIYSMAGHNPPMIYVLQLFLGVGNMLLVYLLGRRLFGHISGLAAMALIMLYAPLVYLEPKILTETLSVTLNLISLILLLRTIERPSNARYLGTGIVFGLAAVCRPATLPVIAMILLWFGIGIIRRRENFRFAYMSLLILGICIAVLPVTVRNIIVGRDLVPICSNGGIGFAQGNSEASSGFSAFLPGFSGSILTQQQEEMAIASKALGHPVKASEASDYWFRVGFRFIREHPDAYIRLLGKKIIWSLHNRESPCVYNVYLEQVFVPILRFLVLPFSILAGLSIFGLIRGRRAGNGYAVLSLFILSILLSMIIFAVSSRYRAPAAPVMAVFAGFGLVQAVEAVRIRRLRDIGLLAMCMLPSLIASLYPCGTRPITSGAVNNLAASFASQGRNSKAVDLYRIALEMRPNNGSIHRNIANALVNMGKLDEAVEEFEISIRLKPEDQRTHRELANVLNMQNKFDEALPHYRTALKIKPDDPVSHYHYAVALQSHGKLDEAIREYREVIRLEPNSASAHKNLAVSLFLNKDYDGAWKEVSECRRLGVQLHSGFLKALTEVTAK